MSEYRFILEPFSCRKCGIPQSRHGRQWAAGTGVHGWAPPTETMIKARMWLRRKDWAHARWLPVDGRTEYRKWTT